MSEKLEKIAIELHRVDTLGVESYNLLSNGQKQAFRRMAIAVVKMQEEENQQLQQDNAKLREALVGLKLDSIKVIDNLVNTGCDEAWPVIKLNNMITDIEDALKTECTTCDNSNKAEECKQLQQDNEKLRKFLSSLQTDVSTEIAIEELLESMK